MCLNSFNFIQNYSRIMCIQISERKKEAMTYSKFVFWDLAQTVYK